MPSHRQSVAVHEPPPMALPLSLQVSWLDVAPSTQVLPFSQDQYETWGASTLPPQVSLPLVAVDRHWPF